MTSTSDTVAIPDVGYIAPANRGWQRRATTALSPEACRNEAFAASALTALCVFSILNPILAQITSMFFSFSIGGLNIMQLFQGLCFLAVLITLPRLSRIANEVSRRFSRLLWTFLIALVLLHLRLCAAGRVPADMVMTERMVYFKIIFALLLWYYASCLVHSYESGQVLLRSVLLGAAISAVWILICYLAGLGGAHYETVGVKATAGSEGISGKAMAGFLVPAAAGAMYLAVRQSASRWALAAALIVAAVFVTFDRSAQVAAGAALLWVIIWWLGFARPQRCSKTVVLFLCVLVIAGGVYYAQHGSEELIARWMHDFDRGEIGSGRGTFYTTAARWFWNDSSLTDFLLGMGYGNIYDLMHAGSGVYRHTHSDLFDMLLIGGVAGLALYVLMFHAIVKTIGSVPRGSGAFALLGAQLASFGVMSLLTGLMGFPHTMYAFGVQCICIQVLATHEGTHLRRSPHFEQWQVS